MHPWQLQFVLLLILSLCSAQSTYYITPSPDTTCPGQNCLTLFELEQGVRFSTSDVTLRFLPGNYTLGRNASFQNIPSLSLFGDISNLPQVTSTIICSEGTSLTFNAIGNLYINGLAFSSCGGSGNYSSAVTVSTAFLVIISDCVFQNSQKFRRNTSTHGGALSVYSSDRVILSGNLFESNSAYSGGAVCIMFSEVECRGNTFVGNRAAVDGGGISCISSNGNITENIFTNNNAGTQGGGCIVVEGRLNFIRNTFKSNQAGETGGAAHVSSGETKFVGNEFSNNTANRTGGGIYTENFLTELIDNSFTGNSANLNAAGVLVGSIGEVSFNNNRFISNQGGGWVVYSFIRRIENFTENVIANNSGNVVFGSSVQNTSVYYVSNAPELSCPGEPCFTLSEYFRQPIEYFTSDVTFVFLPGNHSLDSGLLIADITSLSFLAVSSSPDKVTSNIVCNSASSFAFIRIATVRIRGLSFISCADGANPAFSILNVPWFEISNCIFRDNVNFNDGGAPGSAIYAQNSNLTVTNSMFLNNRAHTGGGAYLMNCTVNVTNSAFVNNSANFNGAGMCMLQSTVNFTKTEFVSNFAGLEGGGLCIFFGKVIFAKGTVFMNNTAMTLGGAMAIGNGDIQFSGNTTFDRNSAFVIGGAVLAFGTSMMFNGNISIQNNRAQYGGALMAAGESRLAFMDTTQFQNNSAVYGGSVYSIASNVSFFGLSGISNNTANFGGGIYASSSNLQFEGTINFLGNAALNGGGLLLTANSKMYLLANTAVYFADNRAEVTGGAVEVEDSAPLEYCFVPANFIAFNVQGMCFFQIQTNTTTTLIAIQSVVDLNTSLNFDRNHASEGGSDLYGGTIDSCTFSNIVYCQQDFCEFRSSGEVFDLVSSTAVPNASRSLGIASPPLYTCTCSCSECEPSCANFPITRRVYPGGSLQIPVIALGQRNGSVPAVIRTSFLNTISFGELEYTQRINNTCTNLRYTILTSVEGIHQVELYAQGPCSSEGRSVVLQIEVLPCPHGFELSNTEQACVCNERLQRFTNTCDVDSATIFRPHNVNFWLGYDSDSQGLILRNECPFDYCITGDAFITVDNSSPLCNFNRSGILCGECNPGFSAVFGTSRCLQCTDDYLSLLLAFAFAGITLVFFLFVLKLTVAAGTIHGLIFYANVVQANSALFFPSGVSNVFIAWLNLDLGIETCFYEGMDSYAKTWLQFVFPVYVWSLVGIIFLISHFSRKVAALLGNNPVAVLATLFLLSYAKFLRTIISALSIAFVEYPNSLKVAVWFNDGNVRYLTGKHIPLFIAAVLSIAFVFLPYTLLLLFSQWIQAKSTWKIFSWITRPSIKAHLDAYHAPYTSKQRYWTGLLLLFRCGVFFVYGGDNISLLTISSTAFFIVTLLTTGIYQNWILTLLESSFILNLGVLATTTLYINLAGGNQEAVTYTSVAIAAGTFVGIVVYHTVVQVRNTEMWKKQKFNFRSFCQSPFSRNKSRDLLLNNSTDLESTLDSAIIPKSVPSTFIELREPLLEDK